MENTTLKLVLIYYKFTKRQFNLKSAFNNILQTTTYTNQVLNCTFDVKKI